jgi:uracil-DNA glycosylase
MRELVKEFLKDRVDSSWQDIILEATLKLDKSYIELILSQEYIPSSGRLFNAFKTLKRDDVKYILFGQDPYPREQSAIGYAFIDGAVKSIFSENGLSKEVNRATSLRNFMKMLLVNMGRLDVNNTTKDAIMHTKRDDLINSMGELKDNFQRAGVLLLNSALIFTDKKSSSYHVKQWRPFIKHLLDAIDKDIELILFGTHAKEIINKLTPKQRYIITEHPFNVSFIRSKEAHKLFGEMNLLFPH